MTTGKQMQVQFIVMQITELQADIKVVNELIKSTSWYQGYESVDKFYSKSKFSKLSM